LRCTFCLRHLLIRSVVAITADLFLAFAVCHAKLVPSGVPKYAHSASVSFLDEVDKRQLVNEYLGGLTSASLDMNHPKVQLGRLLCNDVMKNQGILAK